MKKIGITTTVPLEILIAAGYQPVDLNNVFISDPDPEHLVRLAERDGFPLNCCSWIKGIYGVCMQSDIDTVLCVTNGDCSNTIMLMEVLNLKGLKTIPFAYPEQPDTNQMQFRLEALAKKFNTTLGAAEAVKQELVDGCHKRPAYPDDILRIAYTGVPSVYGQDLYKYLETKGARVVFNEIQRQFAMPQPGDSLAEQYSNYTYPYSIHHRLKDITTELERRRVDGLIHYVQAFCHRGIGDIIFHNTIKLPILTLEGNDDFYLNQHIKTRVEAFIDMLKRNPKRQKHKNRTAVKQAS